MNKSMIDIENERDAGVVDEICGYLTSLPPRSYFLFAGAGSGKTRTLVEVLRRLTGVVEHAEGGRLARQLRLYGRSIRVITYTKNAVAVVNGRLGNNDLVEVSTIHAFCWELISGFNDDIRAALISIKEAQHAKEMAEALTKPKGITSAKQRNLDEINEDIESYRKIDVFIYHPDRETYGLGALAHKHVLDVTAWLLQNRPTLQAILKDRYPIVLIDESQDTMKGMLDALISLTDPHANGITIGLLGDHRQRIYADGHADLPRLIPQSWATPKLQMNHRSQRRIVDLINTIWDAELVGRTQPVNGIMQHSRTEKTGGLVRVYIGDTSFSPEEKVRGEHWCADQIFKASGIEAWSTKKFQLLALEHKLVATRGSFLDVYNAMDLLDPNSAAPSGSGENKGPTIVKILLNELADLEGCLDSYGVINEFRITEILNRYECLDEIPEDPKTREIRVKEILDAISAFSSACSNSDSTVAQVLEPIIRVKLFKVDNRLVEALNDNSPPPAAPVRGKKNEESKQSRIRRGLCTLFASPWSQLKGYRNYLSGNSVLATHQVVKGSEFPHVMVVMDDIEAGGTLFGYDKLFGGNELSQRDKENFAVGKETAIDRTLRLLYVTCSRAEESLALVLWSSAPTLAIKKIKESGWFAEDEIQEIRLD
ncbi:UvrD-helicase domain-containing protein [Acinetobacter sp. ANC 4945]|uniref:DNA 3'-5' helicase II n=1 Tax=Acinetobacter amyesii TaxID=2942470 RepID=A0A1T1GPW3_9GAMM|nr:UvrD-helicase domain-containing protein [Acinetobacter amyesii]MCL6248402.1 UvrD-helicase domain-containing protein [Acinetobacter amyesii]OOV79652.1 Fis family transcriptional regulator [Acinetobacter amyesii]